MSLPYPGSGRTPRQQMDEELAYAAENVANRHPSVQKLKAHIKKKIHRAMKSAVRKVKVNAQGEEMGDTPTSDPGEM